jgi:hypothetical protein
VLRNCAEISVWYKIATSPTFTAHEVRMILPSIVESILPMERQEVIVKLENAVF